MGIKKRSVEGVMTIRTKLLKIKDLTQLDNVLFNNLDLFDEDGRGRLYEYTLYDFEIFDVNNIQGDEVYHVILKYKQEVD